MSDLLPTPLTGLHEALGAKMTQFAGYTMPLQYPTGVMTEHNQTRNTAGLFDVSHMGQIILRHPDGVDGAARALESLVPVDLLGLAEMRQRYAFFTSEDGGLLDDLMIAKREDHLLIVANAACKAADLAHMRANLPTCEITLVEDRALIALQGPKAEAALVALVPAVEAMLFQDVIVVESDFGPLWITRSGYTGEDGFEVSVTAEHAEPLARALLDHPDVAPVGLGARDSLRLEAGLCLYGQDIGLQTSPAEARLEWAIGRARRSGGEREAGFPGAKKVLAEIDNGAQRVRVGLRPDGRAPMRQGTLLFSEEGADTAIGDVSSGAFGPTIGAPVAMGYVPAELAAPGTSLWGEVRGKRLPLHVARLPFTQANFKRATRRESA